MLELTFKNSKTGAESTATFSKSDKKLYAIHNWFDDGDDYFEPCAAEKKIPRTPEGIRKRFDRWTTWYATQDGRIYQHAVTKEWNGYGDECHYEYIQPDAEQSLLEYKMNFGFDSEGIPTSESFVYILGKKTRLPNGTEEENAPIIHKFVELWKEQGCGFFDELDEQTGYGLSPRYLTKKEQTAYRKK